MIKLELPFWNDKNASERLIKIAQGFWEKVEAGLRWPLSQFDARTCSLVVLNQLAWQRDITRIKGESIELYRLRVQYAYANAADAGSTAGFKRIFLRLGVGYIEVAERVAGKDWDVIVLRMKDGQLAGNSLLLQTIIRMYGRTCRRYEFEVITPLAIEIAAGEFSAISAFDSAAYWDEFVAQVEVASVGSTASTNFDSASYFEG